MIRDVIVEEARRARRALIERYGGLDGLIDHLQEMDRLRLQKERERKRKAAAKKKADSESKPKKRSVEDKGHLVNGKKSKQPRGRKARSA